MNVYKKTDRLLYIGVFSILAVIVLRDLIDINISSIPFAVIILYFAFLLKGNNYISYLFFIFPLVLGIPGSYVMPVLAALCLFRFKNIRKNAIAFFLIFSMLELVHFMLYSFPADFLLEVRYLSCLLIFVLVISDFSNDPSAHEKRAFFFVIGCVSAMLCIMLNTYIQSSQMGLEGSIRLGNYLTENLEETSIRLSMNPNTLAYLSVISMSISLVALQDNFFKRRKFIIFSMIVVTLAGFLTISRTWMLVVVIMFIIYLNLKTTNYKLKYFFIVIVLLLVAYLLFYGGSYVDTYLDRFTDSTVRSGGSRTNLFTMYNEFLLNNPFHLLFGTGSVYYREVCQLGDSSHNSLQQVYVSYGIIGFFIFIAAYLKLLLRLRQISLIYWLPVVVNILFMQSIQFLNPFFLMFPVAVSLELLKAKRAAELLGNY